jgi:hypothetical protein
MKIVESEPKRLPFERTYLLESKPCVTCSGTGTYQGPTSRMNSICYGCRGLGRRITPAGRELWRAICRELGKPAAKESRIQPKYLETIYAEYVKPGMCVGAIYPTRRPPKVVTAVEELAVQLRFTFEGRSQAVFSKHDMLARVLTEPDIERAERLMAAAIGEGSTK